MAAEMKQVPVYYLLMDEKDGDMYRIPELDFKEMFELVEGKDRTYQFTAAAKAAQGAYSCLDTYMCSYQVNHARSMWVVGESSEFIVKGTFYWHDNIY